MFSYLFAFPSTGFNLWLRRAQFSSNRPEQHSTQNSGHSGAPSEVLCNTLWVKSVSLVQLVPAELAAFQRGFIEGDQRGSMHSCSSIASIVWRLETVDSQPSDPRGRGQANTDRFRDIGRSIRSILTTVPSVPSVPLYH